jgi:hypothetical protein
MTFLKLTFLSLNLLFLASCGSEQFGVTPETKTGSPDPVTSTTQEVCSARTLIKPQIDFLYVVDNSTSNNYISSSIRNEIQNTIGKISDQFDYRVIGTPLLKTAAGDQEFQVFSKDPSFTHPKKVASISQFDFFSQQVPGSSEPGLRRVVEFLGAHQSDGLFRRNAYLFIILISNGLDTEVEGVTHQNGQTGYTTNGLSVYNQHKNALLQFKTYFNSQQLRFFSLVPHVSCQIPGWRAATRSYIQMSQDLYFQPPYPSDQAGRTGQGFPADSYNLCGGSIGEVFSSINASINQITIPHSYKYWPITSTNGTIDTQSGRIKVYKKDASNNLVELTSGWSYLENPHFPGPIETRVDPSSGILISGEPTSARHLIEFSAGNYPTYPDCISVTTLSNLEYFGFVVLPKIPQLDSVVLKIRGQTIPQSSSNGWSYIGEQTRNIKVPHDGYPDTPPVIQTGYMLQLNGSENYYKSGDAVDLYYIPAQK